MYKSHLKNILNQKTSEERREWFVEHIKGFGYKEASHFLRNMGYAQYAIPDNHILTLLTEFGIFNLTKTIKKLFCTSKRNYMILQKKYILSLEILIFIFDI